LYYNLCFLFLLVLPTTATITTSSIIHHVKEILQGEYILPLGRTTNAIIYYDYDDFLPYYGLQGAGLSKEWRVGGGSSRRKDVPTIKRSKWGNWLHSINSGIGIGGGSNTKSSSGGRTTVTATVGLKAIKGSPRDIEVWKKNGNVSSGRRRRRRKRRRKW